MTERFEIGGAGREVGILDHKNKTIAVFHGSDPVNLRWRLDRAVTRLQSEEDTPTGYVWEKQSQVGIEQQEES